MSIALILSQMRNYRDQWNLLTQASKDGGDTAQRTGSLYTLLFALGQVADDKGVGTYQGFTEDLHRLRVAPGRYVRHPSSQDPINGRYIPWYSNPNNFTRDQSVVLQSALVLSGDKDSLRELVQARKQNYFMHFNTESYDDSEEIRKHSPDIPSPIEFAQFIRGLDMWWARPLLYILDLQLLLDVFFRSLNKRNLWDTDNSMMPVMLSCLGKWPTFIGKLARYLYSKTDAPTRLAYYHSEMNNGIEPLGDLYVLAFNRLIKGEK